MYTCPCCDCHVAYGMCDCGYDPSNKLMEYFFGCKKEELNKNFDLDGKIYLIQKLDIFELSYTHYMSCYVFSQMIRKRFQIFRIVGRLYFINEKKIEWIDSGSDDVFSTLTKEEIIKEILDEE